MTKIIDDNGRSLTERILDAHRDNCAWPKKLIAEVLGTTESYVNYVFQTYSIRVGIPQTRANRERPTAGKVRTLQPFVSRTPPNQECQFRWLDYGKLHTCKRPTNGHTYCPECAESMARQPAGRRYASFSGPAFGMSRRTGAPA